MAHDSAEKRVSADPERRREFQRLGLITAKPMLYLLNLDEASAATGNE